MVLSLRIACIFLVFLISCSEKKTERQPLFIIQGFQITDAIGQAVMFWGPNDQDWQVRDWSTLSATEQGFLNFSDNIDMSNTVVTTLNTPVAYPNPFGNISAINFHANDSVKVKLAIVDSMGTILKTHAAKIKGNQSFQFDMSAYADRMSLRYFFSYSAAAQANFKAGYGDVKICRGLIGTANLSSCF